jgi:hypothetical protein
MSSSWIGGVTVLADVDGFSDKLEFEGETALSDGVWETISKPGIDNSSGIHEPQAI